MRRRYEKLSFDPQRADFGVLAQTLAAEDKYFDTEESEDTLVLIIEQLLSALPERQRACVEMCSMKNMSYAEVGRMLGCADQTARRETMRGLAKIKLALENTPWAMGFTFRFPTEEGASVPTSEYNFEELLIALGEEEDE